MRSRAPRSRWPDRLGAGPALIGKVLGIGPARAGLLDVFESSVILGRLDLELRTHAEAVAHA